MVRRLVVLHQVQGDPQTRPAAPSALLSAIRRHGESHHAGSPAHVGLAALGNDLLLALGSSPNVSRLALMILVSVYSSQLVSCAGNEYEIDRRKGEACTSWAGVRTAQLPGKACGRTCDAISESSERRQGKNDSQTTLCNHSAA